MGGIKMKTRFLIILAVMFIAATAFAVPQTINYQGYLEDAVGTPVNATVSMDFAIYNVPTGGTLLWTETQGSVTVTEGAFSVTLGINNAIDLPFDVQYYLGVNVNSDGEMTPRAELTSVPYAMRAKEVDIVNAASHNHDADYVNVAGDSMSGSLTVSTTSGSAVYGYNTGIGMAGRFITSNASNTGNALRVETDGIGDAVYGYTSGTGRAGYFRINNTGNASPALQGETFGSGAAIYGYTAGGGKAGWFQINNPANNNNAIHASTNGIATAGFFEILNAANANHALYAQTNGMGGAGLFFINNTDNTFDALHAETDGTGYSGYFGGGSGVYVSGNLNVTGNISGNGAGLTGVVETDPQVGAIAPSYVPRWTGSMLTTGTVYDNGTNVGIGISSPSAKLHVNGTVLATSFTGDGSGLTGVEPAHISFYATTIGSTLSLSWQTVVFTGELHDDGAAFSASQFTAPYNGVYHFSVGLKGFSGTQTNTYAELALYKNGSQAAWLDAFTADGIGQRWGLNGSVTMKLLAGDIVDLRAYGNDAGMTISSSSYFSGHLLY
jgi:hypothetical protein